MVDDNLNEKIKQKTFHCEIQNDTEKIDEELKCFKRVLRVPDVTTHQIRIIISN